MNGSTRVAWYTGTIARESIGMKFGSVQDGSRAMTCARAGEYSSIQRWKSSSLEK